MTSVDVKTPAGKTEGTVTLPAEIFDVQVNVPLIHQVVVAQLAAKRAGTADTKDRGEVRGSGKKPFKQKGTGRARQGSVRAPHMKGGGVVHGPTPRKYDQRTPKKMKAQALKGALSDRARDGRVHVITSFVEGDVPSTKTAIAIVNLVVKGPKVLAVVNRGEDNAALSLRNAQDIHVIFVDQLNSYDVLIADDVVFTKSAFDAFVSQPNGGKSVKATASESEIA
jgi:large subunit ribosomal protein L4